MTTNEQVVKRLAEKLYGAFWRGGGSFTRGRGEGKSPTNLCWLAVASAAIDEMQPPPATVERVREALPKIVQNWSAYAWNKNDTRAWAILTWARNFAPDAAEMLGVLPHNACDCPNAEYQAAECERLTRERDEAIRRAEKAERERDAAIKRANESDRLVVERRDRALGTELDGNDTSDYAVAVNALRQRDAARLERNVAIGRAELAERALEQEVKTRDEYHEWADQLAYAIAPVEQIGEHSSSNNPWENAIRVAGEDAKRASEAENMLHATEAQLRALRDTVVQCTVALRHEVDAPSTAE